MLASKNKHKSMKTILCAVSLFLFVGTTGSIKAQATKSPAPAGQKKDMKNVTPEEQAKMEVNRADKQLGLNQEQKAKWMEAAVKRITANRPLREKMKGSTTPEERKKLHEVARSNREAFDASIAALLKPEQVEKYEEMKRNHQAKAQEKRKEHMDKNKPAQAGPEHDEIEE